MVRHLLFIGFLVFSIIGCNKYGDSSPQNQVVSSVKTEEAEFAKGASGPSLPKAAPVAPGLAGKTRNKDAKADKNVDDERGENSQEKTTTAKPTDVVKRMVAYTGSLILRATDTEQVLAKAREFCEASGGYIERLEASSTSSQ